MATLPAPARHLDAAHGDQRVRLHDVGWREYESLLTIRGEQSGVRLTYLEGELELMRPSIEHEALKTRLARLLEAYAEERGIELEGYGSWTVKSEDRQRGAEADECYVLGTPATSPQAPDLAIAVVWTSGGIDKLEVYRGLGVAEVWFWRDGGLRFFILQGERHVGATRSGLLPGLDPELLARFMTGATQTQAARAYRAALRDQEQTASS